MFQQLAETIRNVFLFQPRIKQCRLNRGPLFNRHSADSVVWIITAVCCLTFGVKRESAEMFYWDRNAKSLRSKQTDAVMLLYIWLMCWYCIKFPSSHPSLECIMQYYWRIQIFQLLSIWNIYFVYGIVVFEICSTETIFYHLQDTFSDSGTTLFRYKTTFEIANSTYYQIWYC